MMGFKKILHGFAAMVFVLQPLLAQAQTNIDDMPPLTPNMVRSLLVFNSAMPVDQALQVLFRPDDYKEIKAFLDSKEIDLTGRAMIDTPVVGGKIFYGSEFAEIQDDLSIKVNGYVLKYDKSQTVEQNYVRFFNAFAGKPASSSAAMQLMLPEAKADPADVYYVAPNGAAADSVAGARYAAGLQSGADFFVSPNGVAAKSVAGARYGAVLKDAGNGLKAAGDGLIQVKDATGKLVSLTVDQSAARLSAGAAKVAALRQAAVKSAVSASDWALNGAKGLVSSGANLATKVVSWPLRAAGALLSGPVGTALTIAAGAELVNGLYEASWNGVFYCGKDNNGHPNYLFNYTSDKSTLGWEHSEQIALSPNDMATLFGVFTKPRCEAYNRRNRQHLDCSENRVVGECTDNFAQAFTNRLTKMGSGAMEQLKASGVRAGKLNQ